MTKNDSIKLVFLGTPDFAVASLDALYLAGFHVVGVITAPDKPAGRNMQLQQSAVKKYAVEKGLHILQPPKLKDPEFLKALEELQADVQVVVAFRMLPLAVWNMPPMGTINLHGSLLPYYRGAAPINWAVINGEKETGVTTFKLVHQIDTGNILLQEKIPIKNEENAGDLHDKMKAVGAALVVKTLQGLLDNTIIEIPQATAHLDPLPTAPKIFTEHCKIAWAKDCQTIYNLIRGLAPYPAAFGFLQGRQMKILKSKVEIVPHQWEAGSHHTDGKTFLKFATADGFVHIEELQLEGKRRMGIQDFLRGFRP